MRPIASPKRRSGRLVLALLAAASVVASVNVSGAAPASNAATIVASVSDGDTLALRDGRRIRLIQIDAPEPGSGECYSRAARIALLSLTPVGSAVVLEADPTLDKVDRYGRLLRYVRRNGVNVNTELVRRGAAAPYFHRGERGRYAERLMAAANSAKASKRGLRNACPGTVLEPNRAVETGASGKVVTTPAPPTTTTPTKNCHPSYEGACLDPNASDYDCAGGSGNGPLYTGKVKVVGPDVFRLDSDGDGYGCE